MRGRKPPGAIGRPWVRGGASEAPQGVGTRTRHLTQHRARQDAERLALGGAWRDHDLVFAFSRGTPVEPPNVNRRWDELRERTGLDWLRLHDLRHGCATFMLAAGVPARTVMEVLGHSEIGVTMNTYTHGLAQLREDAADAIDRVLGV
jgi:integrase